MSIDLDFDELLDFDDLLDIDGLAEHRWLKWIIVAVIVLVLIAAVVGLCIWLL